MPYDIIGNPAGWFGDKIGWYLKSNGQALLNNNAKYFGSYGSDLPVGALAPVVQLESSGSDPYQAVKDAVNSFETLGAEPSGDSIVNPMSKSYKSSARSLAVSPGRKAEVDFINAELAKHYGMSKATAYQEALSNTAYQRSVKDMKAAGLNPAVMFGSGRAQSASASIYASDQASGGGSGRRYRGSSSGNGKLFSSGMYHGISTAVGLATAVMTGNPANYWIGSAGAQGVMGALDAVWRK